MPPLKIGFDIDDTLLFSSTSFYYADNHFKPNSQKYWQFINTSDGYSLPKQMGKNLIKRTPEYEKQADYWSVTDEFGTPNKTTWMCHYPGEGSNELTNITSHEDK